MPDSTCHTGVLAFLHKAKACLTNGNWLLVTKREKNWETLIELGMTQECLGQELLQLTPPDYYAGPEPDDMGNGVVWVFIKTIQSRRMYIKLSLREDQKDGAFLRVLSFHFSN